MNQPQFQMVPVTCPSCHSRFMAPVVTIIDVGEHPEIKTPFLLGQINIAACPQCGNAGRLGAPLVYHDPDKELLLTYLPAELGLTEADQQRVIGDLTNRVMSSLPPEKRKGYLLRPRSFLRLEGLIEAVLEADGLTPEILESQRARAALLDRLLRAGSEPARQIIAQEHDGLIDAEFFRLLALNIELTEMEGQSQVAAELRELRRQLLGWTTVGRQIAAREQAIQELGPRVSRETLLEKLVNAALAGDALRVETMVTVARPLIDYLFYQQLTERIEAAEQGGKAPEAEALKALRQQVLDLTAQLDERVRQASQEAARFLDQILASEDLEQAVRANLDRFDPLLLEVLASALDEAEQLGPPERAAKLRRVSDILLQLVQESQPAEIQFINQLLAAEYPNGTRALLEQNRDRLDGELLELMRAIEEDVRQDGRTELSQRLAEIQRQVAELI